MRNGINHRETLSIHKRGDWSPASTFPQKGGKGRAYHSWQWSTHINQGDLNWNLRDANNSETVTVSSELRSQLARHNIQGKSNQGTQPK